MIEVFPNLFVGKAEDLQHALHADRVSEVVRDGWAVITAAKDPWHRELLGYTGRGAPKDHPEYLWAERERRLFLNLVDAADPDYIRVEIISRAIEFIDDSPANGRVLIHCNQGESRAPTLALLYLRLHPQMAPYLKRMSFEDACAAFAEVYPPFNPADGMRKRAQMIWEEAADV